MFAVEFGTAVAHAGPISLLADAVDFFSDAGIDDLLTQSQRISACDMMPYGFQTVCATGAELLNAAAGRSRRCAKRAVSVRRRERRADPMFRSLGIHDAHLAELHW
jgi:hypothetical protein